MNNLEALDYGIKIKESNILSYSIDSELLLANVLNLTREKLLISLKNQITKKIFGLQKINLQTKKKSQLHIF